MSSEHSEHHQKQRSFFATLSPKTSFFLGLGAAVALSVFVGFFVLLGVVLNKDDAGNIRGASARSGSATAPSAAAPSPTPRATAPSAAGEIQLAEITDDDWIKGDPNAKISIVEFSDTECPFCKRVHPTLQQIVEDYDGEVNWVYRHFPLTSIHPKAPKEAEATECAGELGGNDGFWAYLDRLFEVTPSNNGLDASQLPQIAEDVGLNVAKFQECLDSGKYASVVQDELAQATAAGGTGTPYSVIVSGDQKVPISGAVPYAQFQSVIDSLL